MTVNLAGMQLPAITELRRSLAEEAETLISRSTGALSSEDAARFEEIEADLDLLRDRETRLTAITRAAGRGTVESGDGATISRRGPEVLRRVDPYEGLEAVRDGWTSPTDMIGRAKKAIDTAPEHMNDTGREHVTHLLELPGRQTPLIARHMLLTGSPEYHAEFEEYMRTGFAGQILRTSMSLTDANGGYLVPFTLDPSIIITNSGIIDPIRQLATIKQIATDTWNGVSSAGVSASWTAEGLEAPDASPTFVQPSITPKRADAWVEGSYEVLADSGFADELGRLLADAKARLEGAAFATGNTGATRPRGIISATAAVTASLVASATTNAFVIGDVYRVADGLRPRDASQATWLASKNIYNKIRQFDTSGSAAFWANLGMGRPPELLGSPAYEVSTMQTAVTTGGLVLMAGNMKQYYIVDRVGMSVAYNPMLMGLTTGRPTGKAGWLAFWRVGADVVDADAFRLLQLNANAAFVPLA